MAETIKGGAYRNGDTFVDHDNKELSIEQVSDWISLQEKRGIAVDVPDKYKQSLYDYLKEKTESEQSSETTKTRAVKPASRGH